MAQVYEIRLKASALENLKGARDQVRQRMGTRHVGDSLTGMSSADAGALANDLLALLDAIDSVVGRAKAADR
jgi:hypothetical protein